MMQAFVYIETVPGLVLLATQVTMKSSTGHMCFYVIPDVLSDSAGLATNHALELPCGSLAHKGINLGIQRTI